MIVMSFLFISASLGSADLTADWLRERGGWAASLEDGRRVCVCFSVLLPKQTGLRGERRHAALTAPPNAHTQSAVQSEPDSVRLWFWGPACVQV